LALDDGHLQSELRGTNGGHVSAGAGTDHDDIKFLCHEILPRVSAPAAPYVMPPEANDVR
jgi:hypothetical protein